MVGSTSSLARHHEWLRKQPRAAAEAESCDSALVTEILGCCERLFCGSGARLAVSKKDAKGQQVGQTIASVCYEACRSAACGSLQDFSIRGERVRRTVHQIVGILSRERFDAVFLFMHDTIQVSHSR